MMSAHSAIQQQQLVKLKKHHEIYLNQLNYYQHLRRTLPVGTVLVTMDFSSIYLRAYTTGNVPEAQIQDYILILEYRTVDGEWHRKALNFLCGNQDCNKNDYHYVATVWFRLFLSYDYLRGFHTIHVFSDGGPHHFKTRFCQFLFHFCSYTYSVDIHHHFFASHHGHSIADGHAGIIKQLIYHTFLANEGNRKCVLSTSISRANMHDGPVTAPEVRQLLQEQGPPDTYVYVLHSIPRDHKPKPKPVPHIKSYHHFHYAPDHSCKLYPQSNCTEGEIIHAFS